VGYQLLAKKTWESFNQAIPGSRADPLQLAGKFEDLVRIVRDDLLRVEQPRLSPEARAVLRSKLGLGSEKKPEEVKTEAQSQPVRRPRPLTPWVSHQYVINSIEA